MRAEQLLRCPFCTLPWRPMGLNKHGTHDVKVNDGTAFPLFGQQ
jgi:hypothetical protein